METETASTLEKLATQFGTTAEKLWPELVQYCFVSGIVHAIGGAILLIFAFWAYKKCMQIKQKIPCATREDALDHELNYKVGLIFAALVAIFGLISLGTSLPNVLEPEGGALKWVIEHL